MRGAVWAHSYVASKWGLRGLTKSAALELAPEDPGELDSSGFIPPDDQAPARRHRDRADGAGRLPAEEVATFVVFLASDESSFSTGSEYVVDGGLICRRAASSGSDRSAEIR